MNNGGAIVVSIYPECIRDYSFRKIDPKTNKPYIVINMKTENYKYKERFPTEEEIDNYKEYLSQKEYEPLIGNERSIEIYKNTPILEIDRKYPKNYIKYLESQIFKNDIIFVGFDLEIREALTKNNIEFVTVCPNSSQLAEWVGRMYLSKTPTSIIDHRIRTWKKDTNNIDNESHGLKVFRLSSFLYFTDIFEQVLIIHKFTNRPQESL